MAKYKKEKLKLQNDSSARNNTVNSTTGQNIDTMSAPVTSSVAMSATNTQSTSESDISEPLLSGALNTLSKQVKKISDSLPEIAKRSDLKQLIESTSGQGKIISENLIGKFNPIASNVNMRLSSIDTVTKNVDRKIDGVLRKKDFDFAETRLNETIQQAENSARNTRSEIQRGLQNVQQGLSGLEQVIANKSGNVVELVKRFSKNQRNSNDTLTQQLSDVEVRLKEIGESTELIQSLPGKIDGLTDLLNAKGLQIKQEFPVLNHDEETLAQLAQYGEKIFQQLTIAARWYARKKPELDKHETEIENLNKTHEKELIRAAKDGEARGRKVVVRNLLARYGENIHDLMESAEKEGGRLNILVEFLKNEGVEQIYQLHEEFEITDDNLMNYEHNIANLSAGKIVITSPGYSFDNQVISKATYMPAEKFFAAQATEQQVEENCAYETPTERTAADSQAEKNLAPQSDEAGHESENVVQIEETFVDDTPTEKTTANSQAEENLAPQSDEAGHESENIIPSEEISVDTNEELSTATNKIAPNETISAEG